MVYCMSNFDVLICSQGEQMKKNGLYIAFEGVDGSGKSSQISVLKDFLESQGKTVTLVKEPGSVTFGDNIRNIVKTSTVIEPRTREFLFMADRSEVISKEVIPALERGEVVISDRCFLTGMSYCVDREKEWPILKELNSIATMGIFPELVINIQISVDTMVERVFGRDNSLDQRETLVRANCSRFQDNLEVALKELNLLNLTLDGEQPLEKVSSDLIKHFS